ncbi:MAG: glycoside hydrolase family 127 protein [Lewinellaceae bacterium]|nr:glycoside hydrolase family 127 protein [Lewinellaceae bacterium]
MRLLSAEYGAIFQLLPGYIYAKRENTVYVNLFATSETTVKNVNSIGQTVPVTISQNANFPWEGIVTIHVTPEKPNTFQLNIRIPGWARGDAFPGDLYSFAFREAGSVSIRLNGKAFP